MRICRSKCAPARTARRLALLCLVAFVAVRAAPATAHDRTTSYSTWDIRGGDAHVTVRLTQLDVSRFPWAVMGGDDAGRLLGTYLTTHLQLIADDVPCPVTDGPRALHAAPGGLVYEWRLSCPAAATLAMRSAVLLDVAPAHLHFARVSVDGGTPRERVLSEGEPRWLLAGSASAAAGTSLPGYIRLGIEHILNGYDHLAFVLGLLLIAGTLGEVAKVVTGFTLAHSLTLGLTVLGYVRPAAAPVEALIGLSIALVAAENIWLLGSRSWKMPMLITAGLLLLASLAVLGHGRVSPLTLAGLALFSASYFALLRRTAHTASFRWAIAFIFGLVHGFGFAAVLVEAGLTTERFLAALFGFNAGVELGQLAVVAVAWPLLYLATRGNEARRLWVVHGGSAAVLALGLFWFVSRAFG